MPPFVTKSLMAGGKLVPLILDAKDTNGTALFNPSIYIDRGKPIVNIRHCQYTFYHSEKKKFPHDFGPLLYLNPEDDITLTTTNFIGELGQDYSLRSYRKVDTSRFDKKPLWEFIGLEDGRLFRWNDKLYLCGVRRDTTPHGEGRMELSELNENYEEISRWRIPAPGNNDTYCEKNWMPILDMPFHFVKWCNPLEIVKIDPVKQTCETVLVKPTNAKMDYRGGSHVVRIGDYYVALTHIVRLWFTESKRKDAIYTHAFLVWDKDWNFVKATKEFSFMNGLVEFACGMATHEGRVLISFGFQDNCAFILNTTEEFILDYIERDPGE